MCDPVTPSLLKINDVMQYGMAEYTYVGTAKYDFFTFITLIALCDYFTVVRLQIPIMHYFKWFLLLQFVANRQQAVLLN